jgi:hypothetical protein
MSLTLTGAGLHRPPAGVGPPVLTFAGTLTGGSNVGSATTFTSASIGTASGFTTRRIIVAISCNNLNGGVVSATIGGISATVHVTTSTSNGDAAIFSADVPTGTTATIVVTQGGTAFSPVVGGIYSVDDALLVSTTPSTSSANTAGATSLTTGSFTETSGGFVVAANNLIGAAGGTGTSIAGFTADGFGGAGNKEYLGSLTSIGSTASVTVTSNWTTSGAGGLAVAAWC